ncbi:MAG: hypothetical protein M1839_002979 [Geoglossum umbratile]|nr:MAG: hypothetical protein M1839_002979 [Geoglossum umbratile]
MSQPNEASVQMLEYKALPDQSIRILTLNPGALNDPLEGRLEFFNIASPEKYEPLSYVWGDPERIYEIICNGSRLGITASLNDALRQLRQPDQPRRLWVDQICINQDNQAERSQQVQFMNSIYKNASHVLVWLGPDHQDMAEPAFKLVRELVEIFQDEKKCEQFRIDHTDHLKERSRDPWIPLTHVTHLPWFARAWIVQEIGTKAPATLLWGDAEIDWKLVHIVCEKLTDYHHLRKHFNIQTDLIKYVFQRFIAPPMTSRHANRFSLIYELHRARHLQVTDARDRVFAMLGHYSVCWDNERLAALRADYEKTLEQVYVEVAVKALTGDKSLIILAAVQHPKLPSGTEAPNQESDQTRVVDGKTLPSWVPNWESFSERTFAHHAFVTHILSEPISPHCAHGETSPKLKIDEPTLVLGVSGVKLDVVEACSEPLRPREFHLDSSGRALAIKTLWHDICGKGRFDLEERYINGESTFFAYTQTLSNGCVATSSREPRAYHEIPKSEWCAQGAAYLTEALGQSDDVSPALHEVAADGDHYKWSRAANGASTHRAFARTAEGYFVLGPKVMEVGDIVCVLFGGKMPFCLRPWGRHYLLIGECYVHGLMNGEAMEMLKQGKVEEAEFHIV